MSPGAADARSRSLRPIKLGLLFAVLPVLELEDDGGGRTATDLDIPAFRFPGAGALIRERGRTGRGPTAREPGSDAGGSAGTADMTVGEVEQGRARVNPAMRDRLVLQAALSRFGCCPPDRDSAGSDRKLLKHGRARTQDGRDVRVVAFGSAAGAPRPHTVDLGHIISLLDHHLGCHGPTPLGGAPKGTDA